MDAMDDLELAKYYSGELDHGILDIGPYEVEKRYQALKRFYRTLISDSGKLN